jgi:hypothetical protein
MNILLAGTVGGKRVEVHMRRWNGCDSVMTNRVIKATQAPSEHPRHQFNLFSNQVKPQNHSRYPASPQHIEPKRSCVSAHHGLLSACKDACALSRWHLGLVASTAVLTSRQTASTARQTERPLQ